MATLVLRFPGGRYHATATGHHVNEGVIEWPPSPWRLIRALIACGYSTQGWSTVPPVARKLVERLSGALPEYRLPEAVLGHSRHYMPVGVLDKGREKTTLVYDTFAHIGEGVLWVRWPIALEDEEATLFASLAENLGYLGRSESWVVARSVSDDEPLPPSGRSIPHDEGSRPGRAYEHVALQAPERVDAYAEWRANEVGSALRAAFGEDLTKKLTKANQKKRDVIEQGYPHDLVACLECDTAWWRGRGWSQAPGSRRVLYWRESNALEVGMPVEPRRTTSPPVQAALLALTTSSGSTSALPSVTRTLPQAELIHRALVSGVARGGQVDCPELTGKDAHGEPLRGHRHAHVVPLDLDADGHLDHVLVHAAMGLGNEAQRALRSLRRTFTKGGVGELRVALAGLGSLSDLRRIDPPWRDALDAVMGRDEGAMSWRSATPFVAPRHRKTKGRNTLEGQIRAELESRGLEAIDVTIEPWSAENASLRHFVRRRRGAAPQPPADEAFVVRLRFASAVRGPICLGYGSHFGLGRFVSER